MVAGPIKLRGCPIWFVTKLGGGPAMVALVWFCSICPGTLADCDIVGGAWEWTTVPGLGPVAEGGPEKIPLRVLETGVSLREYDSKGQVQQEAH